MGLVVESMLCAYPLRAERSVNRVWNILALTGAQPHLRPSPAVLQGVEHPYADRGAAALTSFPRGAAGCGTSLCRPWRRIDMPGGDCFGKSGPNSARLAPDCSCA